MLFLTESILTLSLAVPCVVQETPATPQMVSRHVTLQVRTEPNYAAPDVARLLSTHGFLGSIARNLVPKGIDKTTADWAIASDPSHAPLVYVSTDGPTSEILSVTFTSVSMEAIERGREAVLVKLGEMKPTAQRRRENERAAVLEAEATARKRLDALRQELANLIETGGTDPNAELGGVRNERQAVGKRLSELERDIALRTATRDYLKQWLDRAHEEKARATDVEGGRASDVRTLLEQLTQAEKFLDEIKTTRTTEHPEYLKAKKMVETLKSQLRQQDQDSNVTAAESRLFGTEEDLFEMMREREWSAVRFQQLDQRERDLTKLAAQFQDLDSAVRRATQSLDVAIAQKEVSDRDWPEDGEVAWIRVLAK